MSFIISLPTLIKDIYDCEKKSHMDKDGNCDGKMPGPDKKGACAAYCEVKIYYTYGQEIPYDLGICQSDECKVATGTTTTITTTWEIDGNVGLEIGKGPLTSAFNISASYSFSTSVSTSLSFEKSEKLEKNECGYWTFVPVFVT